MSRERAGECETGADDLPRALDNPFFREHFETFDPSTPVPDGWVQVDVPGWGPVRYKHDGLDLPPAAGHLPPPRKAGRPPTRGAAATRAVRVRLTPDEHAAVVAAATARGESLSEYVRGRVL